LSQLADIQEIPGIMPGYAQTQYRLYAREQRRNVESLEEDLSCNVTVLPWIERRFREENRMLRLRTRGM
jgi:hypothetical protein